MTMACISAAPRGWLAAQLHNGVSPVLKPRYRLTLVKHQRSLTMFLLARTP